jgi:pyrroloquinoline-quinone synthase
MIESIPLPETTSLIETFRKNTKDVPFTAGISALYAYESQVPEIAGTKIDGLKSFYGIDDPRTLKFFIVHHSLDVEHARVTRDLIAKYGEDEAEHDGALDAVDKVTAALWSFLDGVHEEYVAGAEATVTA